MSPFALKLAALLAMALDHVGYIFGWEGWNLLPFDSAILRAIGRLSFPVFAWGIVNGWQHTRDREQYARNLSLCAILSQIPFTLAFYPPNLMDIFPGDAPNHCVFRPWIILVALFCTVTYWYFPLRRQIKPSLFAIGGACLLPAVFIQWNHVWMLADSLNVLYTLLLGVSALYAIEQLRSRSLRWWESLWLIIAFVLAAAVYGTMADYGTYLMGLVLILLLYAAEMAAGPERGGVRLGLRALRRTLPQLAQRPGHAAGVGADFGVPSPAGHPGQIRQGTFLRLLPGPFAGAGPLQCHASRSLKKGGWDSILSFLLLWKTS